MSTYKIREIKREIRVLGIAVTNVNDTNYLAVGVIFRGSCWIDGVITSTICGPDLTKGLSQMIKTTKHYPQIRVLLTARLLLCEDAVIDPIQLSIDTIRPVICLGINLDNCPGNELKIEKLGEFNGFSVGLDKTRAEKILSTASRDSGFPEALRVAELIIKSYSSNRT